MGAKKLKMPERTPAEEAESAGAGPVLVRGRAVGMKAAQSRARREVAGWLPEVVRELGREAAGGSVAHAKLFLEVSGVLKSGLAAPEKAKGRTLEEILTEQWERDKNNAAADAAEQRERRAYLDA